MGKSTDNVELPKDLKQQIYDAGYSIADMSRLIKTGRGIPNGVLKDRQWLGNCFSSGYMPKDAYEQLMMLLSVHPTPVEVDEYAKEIDARYVDGQKFCRYYLMGDGKFINSYGYELEDWREAVHQWNRRYIFNHPGHVISDLEDRILWLEDELAGARSLNAWLMEGETDNAVKALKELAKMQKETDGT